MASNEVGQHATTDADASISPRSPYELRMRSNNANVRAAGDSFLCAIDGCTTAVLR